MSDSFWGGFAVSRSQRREWNLVAFRKADSAEPALRSQTNCRAFWGRFGRRCGPPLSTSLVEFVFGLQGGFCRTRLELVGKLLCLSDSFREVLRSKFIRRVRGSPRRRSKFTRRSSSTDAADESCKDVCKRCKYEGFSAFALINIWGAAFLGLTKVGVPRPTHLIIHV